MVFIEMGGSYGRWSGGGLYGWYAVCLGNNDGAAGI
jgi:hypothetical protein